MVRDVLRLFFSHKFGLKSFEPSGENSSLCGREQ